MMQQKTIQTQNGTIFYRMGQHAGETAIIFIHGAAGDSRLFHGQLRHFADSFPVIGPDLPAHGRSQWNCMPSMDEYSNAIIEIIKQESLQSVVLVGHSMGGCVCLDIFGKYPGRIKGMVLVSTGSKLPVSDELMSALKMDPETLGGVIMRGLFSRDIAPLVDMFKTNFVITKREIIDHDLRVSRELDYDAMLGDISVPVLVIANRNDVMVPLEKSSELAGNIPGARLTVFEYYGHLPFFEHKNEFNQCLESFLSNL